MMNHNLEEKLSALFDGELDTNEVDDILDALEKDAPSDSYWGDKERYRFRAMIDSYTPTIEMNQGQDRSVKTTFTIRLNG